MATKKKEPKSIRVPSQIRSLLIVEIEGTSPLVMHRFPEKAKRQIREKQQKLAKLAKEARDPEAEYEESVYQFANGDYGFPTGAFAESVVNASVDVMPKCKSMLRRNLFVENEGYDPRENRGLIKITDNEGKRPKPEMREDVVRLAGASRPADLRYRGAFAPGWKSQIRIRFDARMLTVDQVVQLVMIAGESIGLCEGRPEKTLAMGWGTFKLNGAQLVEGEEEEFAKKTKSEAA